MSAKNVGRPLVMFETFEYIRQFMLGRDLMNVRNVEGLRLHYQLTEHQRIYTGEWAL